MGTRRSGHGTCSQGRDHIVMENDTDAQIIKTPFGEIKEGEVTSFGGIRKGFKNLGNLG